MSDYDGRERAEEAQRASLRRVFGFELPAWLDYKSPLKPSQETPAFELPTWLDYKSPPTSSGGGGG